MRVVISGYYGFDNAGDEAVLAGLVRSLRAEDETIAIVALSIDPARTAAEQGVAAAHRYRLGPLIRSIWTSDLLLSGGGSLLQDVTSAHGIFYYCGVVRAAQILGRKTMFAAQGIGPLDRRRSQKLVASVANRLDAVTVRDSDSMGLLRQIGVRRPIEVTADPALLLAGDAAGTSARAVVSLRPWPNAGDLADRLAAACAKYLSGYNIATLAMQPGKDAGIVEQFAHRLDQRTGGVTPALASGTASARNRVAEIVRELGACRLVVGMRLHALIIAAGAGVPSIALAYDPKIGSFMRSTGQEDAVCALDASDETLADTVCRVAESIDGRTEDLRSRLPGLRELAQRNARIALEIIK